MDHILNPYGLPDMTYWRIDWSGPGYFHCTQRMAPDGHAPALDNPRTDAQPIDLAASCTEHAARLLRVRHPGAICYFRWPFDPAQPGNLLLSSG